MDFAAEMRQTYLNAVPHTAYTALIWITSGLVGDLVSIQASIVIFIIGCTFIFPMGELIRKLANGKNFLSPDNKHPKLLMQIAFMIPLGYPLIYMACKSNINYFYPAFAVLVGAHYLPLIYGYGKYTFGIVGVLLVLLGSAAMIYANDSFTITAYATGGLLFFLASVNFYHLKKNIA